MKRAVVVSASLLVVCLMAVGLYAQMMDMRSKELKDAATIVMQEKEKLIKAGKYGCCLKHPCNQCALMMGACPCGKNAAEGKPVCHECKGGWDAGDGAIPGKRSRNIKVMPRSMHGEEKK